jgi:hypothetical protein
VRTWIDETRAETKQEFAAVRAQMNQGFADVRMEMNQGFADVRTDMNPDSPTFARRCASCMRIWSNGSPGLERQVRARDSDDRRRRQISIKSRPTTIVPRKPTRAASIHIASVIVGSSAGTRCESTSVLTPAAAATRPTSSTAV